jgi:hypothetical protein
MSANRVRWQPLLAGEDAVAARAVIDDIAAVLAADSMIPDRPSLSGGSAGQALFYAYLGEVWPERGFNDLAVARLERAIDQMAEQSMRAELYSGITGIAWVAEHLQAGAADLEDEDANLAVDELLHLEGRLLRRELPVDCVGERRRLFALRSIARPVDATPEGIFH